MVAYDIPAFYRIKTQNQPDPDAMGPIDKNLAQKDLAVTILKVVSPTFMRHDIAAL